MSDRDGWRRLEPGVYDDPDGRLHLFADELLAAHGFEPSPENIERFAEELAIIAQAYGIVDLEVDE